MFYAENDNGQPSTRYRRNRPFTLNDIQYPSDIWTHNDTVLADIGLYPLIKLPNTDEYHAYTGKSWSFVNDQFVEQGTLVLKDVDIIKARRVTEVRQQAQNVKFGGITVATKPMSTETDQALKVSLIGAALSQGQVYPPAGIPFYTMESERVVLNDTQFATLAKDMAIHLVNCDANADTHEDAINALTTAQEVVDYDITTGWPANPVLAET